MQSACKVIKILAAENGLLLRGKDDNKFLRFKKGRLGARFCFLISGLSILGSYKKDGEELVLKQFDLYDPDSLSKLNDFML
tara:strand:+ start:17956 stop:18198 length:243 start_codon:yes stop_codon:yes gene_type:complete